MKEQMPKEEGTFNILRYIPPRSCPQCCCSQNIFYFNFYEYDCMDVCIPYECLCRTGGSFGMGVKGECELPGGCWEPNPRPLQEQRYSELLSHCSISKTASFSGARLTSNSQSPASGSGVLRLTEYLPTPGSYSFLMTHDFLFVGLMGL